MRGAVLCLWLLFPAAVLAYHYGPGQQQLVIDDAGFYLRQAQQRVAKEEWSRAVEQYTLALELLPETETDTIRKARLERSKAQMLCGELPAAYDDLTLLVEELETDSTAPADFENQARLALANAQYYVTWLMRLEGQPRDEWEPQIEAARQNYRRLAELPENGNAEATLAREEDLEAAIRLARLDLSDLQALAMPSQCKGCKSGQCKCKGKCKKKGKGKDDSKDGRGAGSGPPPDGRGS